VIEEFVENDLFMPVVQSRFYHYIS